MKHTAYKYTIVAAVATALIAVVACDDDDDDSNIIFGIAKTTDITDDTTSDNNGSDDTRTPKPTAARTTINCASRLEVPAIKDNKCFFYHSSIEGTDTIVTYSFEYDTTKYHSRWIAFRFDAATRPKNVSRKDNRAVPQYPHDDVLPMQFAIDDDESFGAGYDHGHLCASADRLYSRAANDNTFYMTNMSPQLSNFNQKYWTYYEEYVQNKGRDISFADTLYVVKGGTIDTDENILGYTCRGRIPIPKYYYMALLKVKNNTYSTLAFWIEHKDYDTKNITDKNAEMKSKIVSIDQLEEYTGIDFFHNLPDNIEEIVEANVTPSAWGF